MLTREERVPYDRQGDRGRPRGTKTVSEKEIAREEMSQGENDTFLDK